MKAHPFAVSLIVPVRNEESGISQLIESLLRQTTTPVEIIIADGGSSDKTREIVKEFIISDHPVKLVAVPHAYPGRGRNLAIAEAKNEWIAMTDAGTFVSLDWLTHLVREASSGDRADVIVGSYEPVLTTFFKECLALAFVAPAHRIGDHYVRGPSTTSMMLRKGVWEALGRFPEHLRACEDLVFFDRLASSKYAVKYAPHAVVQWHIPDDFAGVFKRFRIYSCHTLKAGLGGRWHVAVGRMYLIGMVFVSLAIFRHWAWLLPPLLGVGLRVHRTIRVRRPSLQLAHSIGSRTYVIVGMLLLWIDLAACVGFLDYLFGKNDNQTQK